MGMYSLAVLCMIVSVNTIMQGADIIEQEDMSVRLQKKLNRAVWLSVLLGQTERSGVMLRVGADVNFSDVDGTSLLMCACMKDDHRTVQLLLSNGADVHKRDKKKQTALMYAASSAGYTIVEMLLAKGAYVWDMDLKRQMSFSYAVKARRADILRRLFVKARTDQAMPGYVEKKDIDQLLLSAVHYRYDDLVRVLLECGVDASGKALKRQCPLVAAFDTQQADMCRLLISYKADISCLGPHKRYSFH